MQRRTIMTGATTGLAALATPALAQPAPAIRWRMATSWPNSLDALQGSAVNLCKRVGQLTDGRFEIRCFAGGELMPALQVMDAVQAGTIECGHIMSSNFIGKNPAFAFDAGLPFGMNIRQQAAWLHDGGGLELMRALYRRSNLIPFPAGNSGAQMGGFFRKEIRTPEDLRGLKMRIPGLGGSVMAKLGAVPQQIPGSEVYAALERGTIDAAEWIGPYDDEKIGLHKVAPYYYAPGWWDTNATMSVQVSLPAWEALSPGFKAAFEVACNEQFMLMPTRYDARNPDALRRMLAQGVQLRIFPRAVMEACYKAAFETYEEIAQSSEDFRTIYSPWKRFLESSNPWFRVAEGNMDAFRFSHGIPG
ncbi:TRAP transporter substrate-binding protein [Belnapia rosea]|uniref:TRAP transporter substrate-binding protein n=1 Tax=Belnapia rosea TaxID=938405 RepID=UPI00088F7145|nr:TRAP transporter substrate-binding protein DctP [Belnapia rosea]SDB06436.1 TRAP-type mannitol/chloroaromatic compound transport system, substrate-binding protein [Belnapia rosea]